MVGFTLVLTLLGGVEPSRDTTAREILSALEGEWEFTLGSRAGTRTVRTVFPGILVAWSESFSGGGPRGEGLIGYDPAEGSFFTSSAHDVPGVYGMSLGRFDPDERTITYEPVRLGKDEAPYRVAFHMEDDDHFHYTMLELAEDGSWTERWTARFRRKADP